MPWRERLLIHVASGYFQGIGAGDWFSLLRENQFAVAPSCLLRAASVTALAVPNSITRALERFRFQQQWEQVEIAPPLFILGHYRSGTTHLHNLIAQDSRFGYLNAYQATYPETFLLTEDFGTRTQSFFLPRSRPFDNVRLGFDVPYEDEIALTNLTRISPYMAVVFPRRASFYDRFLTFRDATDVELTTWRAGFRALLQKLTFKVQKPLVLKSPPHTARIKLLLEMFPDAKFVHIHRHPYEVIQSTQHLIRVGLEWIRFQNADCVDWTDRALRQYREMHEAYFDERPLIPDAHFHELAFADLERDPIGTLRHMYHKLALPPFDEVESSVRSYLESLAGYTKNSFSEIPPDLKSRVREYCQRALDAWGYSR